MKRLFLSLLLIAAALWVVSACSQQAESPEGEAAQTETGGATAETPPEPVAFAISSSAFKHEAAIPAGQTCDGENLSPPLSWVGVPEGTKSLALICEDPDAPGGTWVHWVMYNIPVGHAGLDQGVPANDTLPGGIRHGTNDAHQVGYYGPCPPRGKPHRYYFKLYALDIALPVVADIDRDGLLTAMKGHVLEQCELMGTYVRAET